MAETVTLCRVAPPVLCSPSSGPGEALRLAGYPSADGGVEGGGPD